MRPQVRSEARFPTYPSCYTTSKCCAISKLHFALCLFTCSCGCQLRDQKQKFSYSYSLFNALANFWFYL